MLDIVPDRTRFQDLLRNRERVPVTGLKEVGTVDPALLFRALYPDSFETFLLESGKGPISTARYTFFGKGAAVPFPEAENPFPTMDAWNFQYLQGEFDYLPHFWGGWVGLLSYESVRWLEPVSFQSRKTASLPACLFMEVDRLWVYDHLTEVLKYIVVCPNNGSASDDYESTLNEIRAAWAKLDPILDCGPPAISMESSTDFASNQRSATPCSSREEYKRWVTRALHYIEEGDVYQVNLAQKFEQEFGGNPFDLYLRLRELNPSPFGGYIRFKEGCLISGSPERLLKIDRGVMETRPIAGTRPRGADFDEDSRLSSELLLNAKEKAEHLMLVDLERNDMGRICEFGTVEVTDLMFLEQYSHVHHIVSNIRGRLKSDLQLSDILRALFPGGTITGCPKIRCMQIIDELETSPRGPYCGSIGYIGYGPHLDLNIIIRSLLVQDQIVSFHAGAGVVADSDPDREYEETLAKAAAMMLALSPAKR